MPSGLVLHERDTLAFDGVGQNHCGPQHCPGLLKRVYDLLHVMAVDAQNVPAEASVFRSKRLDGHDVFDQSIDLQAIAVYDPDQILELVVAGLHGGFPRPDLPAVHRRP